VVNCSTIGTKFYSHELQSMLSIPWKFYYNWWNGYEDYTVWKLGGSETKLPNSKTHVHCVHDKVEHCCFYQYLQYLWSDLLNIWYIVSPSNLTLVSELSEHLVEKSGFVEFSGHSWCSKCPPSAHTQAKSRWRHALIDSAVNDLLIEPAPLFTTLLSRKTGLLV